MFLPHVPGLLRDVFVDALAELTRVGRLVQPRQGLAQLGAFHHSLAHDGSLPNNSRRQAYRNGRSWCSGGFTPPVISSREARRAEQETGTFSSRTATILKKAIRGLLVTNRLALDSRRPTKATE